MPCRRAVLAAVLAIAVGDPARSAVIVVDSPGDAGAGNCTLREAILAADTDAAVDGCPAGSGPDEIDLTGLAGDVQLGAGQIEIASEVTVRGPGARALRIRGTTSRMFMANAPANATFRDVAIGNASLGSAFGNGVCFAVCGAVLTLERVRLTQCDFTSVSHLDSGFGGAIGAACEGAHDVRIRDSLLDGNDVQGPITGGGAISLSGGGVLTIENSTLSGNTTSGGGGAIRLDSGSTAALRNVTLHGNSAQLGASIFVVGDATATVANSALAAAGGSPHCATVDDATLTSLDFNLAEDASCAFAGPNDLTGPAVLLALADNGGPTDTHLPEETSPLIDGGNPLGCRDAADLPIETDQRGSPRPTGERCDVGAVEVGPCPPAPATCTAAGRGSLALSAARPGKEKLDLALSAFAAATTQADLGDPVGGDSAYTACLYAGDALAAAFVVDRAGLACGTKACWKSIGPPPPSPKGKGFAYKDPLLEADGVLKLSMKGGAAGKGKAALAVRGASLAETFDALTDNAAVTAQLHASDGVCLGAELDQVVKDDPVKAKFKALRK